MFAPAKTPSDAISPLIDSFTAALGAPDVKQQLGRQGLLQVGVCGADFGALLRKQFDEYGRIIREASIRTE
jgi:tripartite-type tricarboxylate transporter receptor subunit TctC